MGSARVISVVNNIRPRSIFFCGRREKLLRFICIVFSLDVINQSSTRLFRLYSQGQKWAGFGRFVSLNDGIFLMMMPTIIINIGYTDTRLSCVDMFTREKIHVLRDIRDCGRKRFFSLAILIIS